MQKEITREEQIKAVERELKYRQHVYPRQVAQGKMSSQAAEYQIAVMRSILTTLREAAPVGGLFGEGQK